MSFFIFKLQQFLLQDHVLLSMNPNLEVGPTYGIASCLGASFYFLVQGAFVRLALLIIASILLMFFSPLYFLPVMIAFLIGFVFSKKNFPNSVID